MKHEYCLLYLKMLLNSCCFLLLQEKLQAVYEELCGDVTAGIAFKVLMEHPIIQDCVSKFTRFKQAVGCIRLLKLLYICLKCLLVLPVLGIL